MHFVHLLVTCTIVLIHLLSFWNAALAQSLQAEETPTPRALAATVPATVPFHAILVATGTQRLYVYRFDGRWQPVMDVPCSTGKNIGPKQKDGDSKTPFGVYFLTRIFKEKELAAVYGSMALTTDYPNSLDRAEGKNGHSIWIHGTNRPLKDRDSNGCIVLENRHVEVLAPLVTLHRTPVIIEAAIEQGLPGEGPAIRQQVDRLVTRWRDSLASGSYHDYLAQYHSTFLPDLSWWMTWCRLRQKAAQAGAPLACETGPVVIYRAGSVLTVLLDQELVAGADRSRAGTRKLFLKPEKDELAIVGEEYLDRSDSADGQEPLVVAAGKQFTVQDPELQVRKMVERWLAAWSAKDIKTYGACYAGSFRSPEGANLREWLAHKENLNRRYRRIQVTGENIQVAIEGAEARVTFLQRYESSGYRARGKKRLALKNEDGKWKIYQETWAGR